MDQTPSRCSRCGNLLILGRCPQCDSISYQKQKKWRTGDRGGKRPERLQGRRTLLDALDGIWFNASHQVTIEIDTEAGLYRSEHPQKEGKTEHSFRLSRHEKKYVRFWKDETLIEVRALDNGLVEMEVSGRSFQFVYLFEGHRFRTCHLCFSKIPE